MGPEGSNTHVTTRVMGTYGYAAPEYVNTGTLRSLLTYTPHNEKSIACATNFVSKYP